MTDTKWQCSEQQARAVTAVARYNQHDWENRVRAAITAAVGVEVDALREALRWVVEWWDVMGSCSDVVKTSDAGRQFRAAMANARAVLAKTGGGK